ncbi:hypothetical protein [Leptothrix cholodnii]|uniref:hypothetical protein n=1 Tax=Leptothrix cholodnii TaxID=34029 RepID=UPI0012376AD2|nr:hypothetical protein [Leptothrix cholodnii]
MDEIDQHPDLALSASEALIQELRLHREAIERAAREAESRHFLEIAHAGFERIRAATRAGTIAVARSETPEARASRRLARLKELGGDLRQTVVGWQVIGKRGALARLVKEESAAGRARSTRQDVTEELHKARAAQMQS